MLKKENPQVFTLIHFYVSPLCRLSIFKKKERDFSKSLSFRDPLGARTQDPNIKSVVLYLLS